MPVLSDAPSSPPVVRRCALFLLLLAVLAGAYLRFPERQIKFMHVDETTQALKLEEMMVGKYHYDPVDHHGPTLLYATLPVKWLSPAKTWNDLTESQVRLVPALFGMGLLALLWLVRDGFSRAELAWGAVAVAVSPLMVFYSRYYIMEMLLVFFTMAGMGCGWRFFQSRKTGWLAGTGICFGAMHATKETCVLHFAAMAAGLAVAGLPGILQRHPAKENPEAEPAGFSGRIRSFLPTRRQFFVLLGSAALTSMVLFSQGFTKPEGIWDSIATYLKMIGRAQGQGHQQPFGYYFQDLLWGKAISAGPKTPSFFDWWSAASQSGTLSFSGVLGRLWEGMASTFSELPKTLGLESSLRMICGERLVVILAAVGILRAFYPCRKRTESPQFQRFLSIYSVVVFCLYSQIAYKTPWCVLGAWHGFLIMAGVGAATLVRMFAARWWRVSVFVLMLAGFAQAGLIAWRVTRDPKFVQNTRNPYNYSMTSPDCLEWVQKIHRFAELSGKGSAMGILQLDGQGGWPMPWYLGRRYAKYFWDGTRVVALDQVDVILASTEGRANLPEEVLGKRDAAAADRAWFESSVRLHTSGSLSVFVRRPLWDAYVAGQPWDEPPLQK